jgi:hypothetical protein
VTEAHVSSIRWDVEVEIMTCRKADFVRVRYEADDVDRPTATAAAEKLIRRILEKFPRTRE